MNLQEARTFIEKYSEVHFYSSPARRSQLQTAFNWLVDNAPEPHRCYGYVDFSGCLGCRGKDWRKMVENTLNMAGNLLRVMG